MSRKRGMIACDWVPGEGTAECTIQRMTRYRFGFRLVVNGRSGGALGLRRKPRFTCPAFKEVRLAVSKFFQPDCATLRAHKQHAASLARRGSSRLAFQQILGP